MNLSGQLHFDNFGEKKLQLKNGPPERFKQPQTLVSFCKTASSPYHLWRGEFFDGTLLMLRRVGNGYNFGMAEREMDMLVYTYDSNVKALEFLKSFNIYVNKDNFFDSEL